MGAPSLSSQAGLPVSLSSQNRPRLATTAKIWRNADILLRIPSGSGNEEPQWIRQRPAKPSADTAEHHGTKKEEFSPGDFIKPRFSYREGFQEFFPFTYRLVKKVVKSHFL